MSKFKGLFKSFKSQLMGSVKADLNSALEGQRNLFNANISNALDDLFAAKFGVNISNVPKDISSHASQMSERKAAQRKLDGKFTSSEEIGSTPKGKTILQFPTDVNSSFVNNWIIFSTMDQIGKKNHNDKKYEIRLPLPKLQDDIDVAYKVGDIGLGGAVAEDLTQADWTEWGSELWDALGTGVDEALTKMGDEIRPIRPIVMGEVQNPVKFQLFENVGFRNHTYTFELHPYNVTDSKQISEMIFALKMMALPTVGTPDEGGFSNPRRFQIPASWEIDYFGPIENQLEKPLPCGLTKVSVDYSGGHDVGFLSATSAQAAKQIEETHSVEIFGEMEDVVHTKDIPRVDGVVYPNGITLTLEFSELITMDALRYQKYVSTKRTNTFSTGYGDLIDRDATKGDKKEQKYNKHITKEVTEEGEGDFAKQVEEIKKQAGLMGPVYSPYFEQSFDTEAEAKAFYDTKPWYGGWRSPVLDSKTGTWKVRQDIGGE